jgi:hypothetical protein
VTACDGIHDACRLQSSNATRDFEIETANDVVVREPVTTPAAFSSDDAVPTERAQGRAARVAQPVDRGGIS